MSTRNIPQLPQIRGQLQKTAGHVRARAEEVSGELRNLARAEEDVRVGAAAVLQSIDDERAPLVEEADQLITILEQAKGEPAPPPAEESPSDVPPQEEATPEAPANTDEDNPPAEDEPTTPAEESPSDAPPQEEAMPEALTIAQRLNPRHWTWWQWPLAILLGLIGLIIGLQTVGWATDWSIEAWLAQAIFGIIWVGVWFGLGFFGGALLSRAIWLRLQRNHPPAPPQ